MRDLAFFVVTIAIGTGLIGGAYVNVLAVSNLLPQSPSIMHAWLRFWIGDAVGILLTGPLLFAIADPAGRATLRALLGDPTRWIEWGMLCVVIGAVFYGSPPNIARRFYVVFLPIIWIAIRSGMIGAIVCADDRANRRDRWAVRQSGATRFSH